MLENLLPEQFQAWLGHSFQLTLSDSTAISLELVEVREVADAHAVVADLVGDAGSDAARSEEGVHGGAPVSMNRFGKTRVDH